jgi:hypothetical protein
MRCPFRSKNLRKEARISCEVIRSYCSRTFRVPRSRFRVPVPVPVPRSPFEVHGSEIRTPNPALRTPNSEPRTPNTNWNANVEPGTWNLELRSYPRRARSNAITRSESNPCPIMNR